MGLSLGLSFRGGGGGSSLGLSFKQVCAIYDVIRILNFEVILYDQ